MLNRMTATLAATLAALLVGAGAAAAAEPVTERDARKMLFNAKGFEMQYVDAGALTETQLGYFEIMVKSRESRDQFGRLAHYYGAIAISPSVFDGSPAALLAAPETVPFQFRTGLHSVAAADAVALAACNALVKGGDKPCVVAARVLPGRCKDQPMPLSVFATDAFKEYRRADGPQAFAASQATRAYAWGQGAGSEALAACNQTAATVGPADCKIVVQDSK